MNQDYRATPDHRDPKVYVVNRVHKAQVVYQDLRDHLAVRELVVHREREESQGLQVTKTV